MAPVSAEHFWALLIGIDFYIPGNSRLGDDGKPIHYPCLTGAVNDTLLARQFLLQRGALESHITTLTATNPSGETHSLYQPTLSEQAAAQVGAEHQVNTRKSYQGRGITRAMIISEFERVTRSAQQGDSVYIHYSGHGGRARSVYEAIKGPNALDESLVPSDIEIPGGQYVRDVELAFLLHQMVKKGLSVTLVLDSCHSGGATRAEAGPPPMVRGIGVVDSTVLESDRTGILVEETLNKQGGSVWGDSRNAEGRQGWLLDPQGYTLLAACLSDEWAHEFRAPPSGKTPHGVFTFSLISALCSVSGGTEVPSNELVHGEVHALVQSRYKNQTPVIQGEGTTTIFGGWAAKGDAPIRVLDRHWREDTYVLGVGQLHGVSEGDEYVILAAEGPAERRELATVEVKEVSDITCTVFVMRYHQPNAQETIQPGCEAIFVKPGRTGQKRVARLVVGPRITLGENGENQTFRQIQKLIRDLAKPRSSHPLRPRWQVIYNQENLKNSINCNDARGKDQVSFLIRIRILNDRAVAYTEIRDTDGRPLPRIPLTPLSNLDSAGILSNYMEHILKYRRVQALAEDPHPDSMGRTTSFDLIGISEEKTPADTNIPAIDMGRSSTSSSTAGRGTVCQDVDGVYQVPENHYIQLLFRNPTNHTVYLTLVDLQPSWGIAKIHPGARGGDYEEVALGDERSLEFRMTIPESTTESRRRVLAQLNIVADVGASSPQGPAQAERFIDHLKAIVMLHPSSLKQLLQSSIVPPPETRGRGGSSEEESTESLPRSEQDSQSSEKEEDDAAGDEGDLIPDLYGEIDEILDPERRNAEGCGDTDGKSVGRRRSQPRSWYTHDIKIKTVPQR